MRKNILTAVSTALLMSSMPILHSTAAPVGGTQPTEFTPEVLMQMWRLSTPVLSPDGKCYVYTRTLPNVKENSSTTEMVLSTLGKGREKKVLPLKGHSPIFLDNETLASVSYTHLDVYKRQSPPLSRGQAGGEYALAHRSFGANAPPTCAYLRGTSTEVLTPLYSIACIRSLLQQLSGQKFSCN